MERNKPFDCVRMMRQIRDAIDRETAAMTGEQRLRWMREQLARSEAASPRLDRREPRTPR